MKMTADKFNTATHVINISWQIITIALLLPSIDVLQKIPLSALAMIAGAALICLITLLKKQFKVTENALSPVVIFVLANWMNRSLLIETIDFSSNALFGGALIIAAKIYFKTSR